MTNSLHGQLCILGDFNIHFDCPHTPLTAKTVDILNAYSLQQVVTEPTHKGGHILDWVIVRPDEQIHRSTRVSDCLESDHYCLLVELDFVVPPRCPVYRMTRNIRTIDRQAFKLDLASQLNAINCTSADQYNNIVRSVLDNHAPVTKRKVVDRTSSPWFCLVSEQLLEAKRMRRQAERKWLSTGLTVFKDLYKKAKHRVTNIVMKAKSLYYNQKISAAQSSKELYKITNNLLSRSKSTPLPTLYPLSSLPDLFCKFFSDKIMTIRHQLDTETTPSPLPENKSFRGFHFLSFEPVTETDVKSVILKSAPKSCALDPMPTALLIECLDVVLPSLTALVNSSFTSGTFPQVFKSALVSLLLKKATLDQNNPVPACSRREA